MKLNRLIAFALFLLANGSSSFAQWAGGTISYKALDRKDFNYEIRVDAYFNCTNEWGYHIITQRTRSIYIGIFDAKTLVRVDSFHMSYDMEREIDGAGYACGDSIMESCLIKKTFTTWRYIDPGPNGKIIAFHTWRNPFYPENILRPTFYSYPDRSQNWIFLPPVKNSSAMFQSEPVQTICKGAPVVLDYSAIDSDGDSLEYFLTNPYSNPKRDWTYFPDPPPYKTRHWAEGYSTGNQIGGAPNFSIHPQTGEVNFIPDTTGLFITCVGVKEFRNGELLTTSRREFWYKVINCNLDIVAAFTTREHLNWARSYGYECSDTVRFVNKSKNAISYSWDFGDSESESDTSTLKNPFYVYPKDGDYVVTLRVQNGYCTDEYSWTVRVRNRPMGMLGEDHILCKKRPILLDTKTPSARHVEWNTGDLGQKIVVRDTGTYIATMYFAQCVQKDTASIRHTKLRFRLPPDSLFCDKVDLVIEAGVDAPKYQWNTHPNDTLRELHVTKAGTYILSVSDTTCTLRDTMVISNPFRPNLQDVFYCNEFEHLVELDSTLDKTFSWSNGATDHKNSFNRAGVEWVKIRQKHCLVLDSFEITNSIVQLDLGPDKHICGSVDLNLGVDSSFDKVRWSTTDAASNIQVDTPGLYWVTVVDSLGCEKSDSIEISSGEVPKFSLGKDTVLCLGSDLVLGLESTPTDYVCKWSTGSNLQHVRVNESGIYQLTVVNGAGCSWTDSIRISMSPFARNDAYYVENAFTPNSDDLNELFPKMGLEELKQYSLRIYDRWGGKIFDSDLNGLRQWDGSVIGVRTPNEVYFYQIEYLSCNGTTRRLIGTVHRIH